MGYVYNIYRATGKMQENHINFESWLYFFIVL
jgi:hypothetical protein